jgi:CheY-like chemotaxis protein
MRVIVADDDLEFLDLIARALEEFGNEVVCATSGDDLQREIAVGTFDAVVTDVSMPCSTGLAAMRGYIVGLT